MRQPACGRPGRQAAAHLAAGSQCGDERVTLATDDPGARPHRRGQRGVVVQAIAGRCALGSKVVRCLELTRRAAAPIVAHRLQHGEHVAGAHLAGGLANARSRSRAQTARATTPQPSLASPRAVRARVGPATAGSRCTRPRRGAPPPAAMATQAASANGTSCQPCAVKRASQSAGAEQRRAAGQGVVRVGDGSQRGFGVAAGRRSPASGTR